MLTGTSKLALALFLVAITAYDAVAQQCSDQQRKLGERIFSAKTFSRSGTISCESCHNPLKAFTDGRRTGVGVDGVIGTRNVPSLIGSSQNRSFFWDGRRTKLTDAVLDAFTNPSELGLSSRDQIIARATSLATKFRSPFSTSQRPTLNEIGVALACFIQDMPSGSSPYDQALLKKKSLPPIVQRGEQLFKGIAGCTECHSMQDTSPRFTDDDFHESGSTSQLIDVSRFAIEISTSRLDDLGLAEKILSDQNWAAFGRFIVTKKPSDIGAFRTPSLRNVAVTAPYMHDGSIPTLEAAVDREIYYRAFSSGHSVALSSADRAAIVEFLKSLTDTDRQQTSKARRF